jgi:hypothetical protein
MSSKHAGMARRKHMGRPMALVSELSELSMLHNGDHVVETSRRVSKTHDNFRALSEVSSSESIELAFNIESV